MRNNRDRLDIERDIFTGHTIAASKSLDELAIAIEQINCKTIDLYFAEPRIGYIGLINAVKPGRKFIKAKDIVERCHLRYVIARFKSRSETAADYLGG